MKKFVQYLNSISWKTSLFYYLLLIIISAGVLTLFSTFFNTGHIDNINFGLGVSAGLADFPEGLLMNNDKSINIGIFAVAVLLSVLVLIIKLFFESIVVVKMMRPPVNLATSNIFILNSSWGREGDKYFTIRILNETPFTLLQVSIKAVLVVKEKPKYENDEIKWYFDITGNSTEIDPSEISIFTPYTPWTYAIKSTLEVNNSIKNYILDQIDTNDSIQSVERSIDLIITGTEAQDGTSFIDYKTIPLDSWNINDGYKKIYKEGRFESLPLEMKKDFHRINNIVES